MTFIKSITITLVLLFTAELQAQQTLGLFLNDSLSFNGYTLVSPLGSDTSYLIDNCGKEVHNWSSQYRPAMSVYLLEDGSLLRTCKMPSDLYPKAGRGGRIEILDWNSNILWAAELFDSLWFPHHDIEYLPSGNILLLAWEYKDSVECVNAGRDLSMLDQYLIPEKIIEIQPVGTDTYNVVWEWHAWDHLVQDFDSTKQNFGIVSDHPELIDLNYFYAGSNLAQPDILHANSLDFHPELNQILISVLKYNEIWIIDHSTSTSEASAHTGGDYGKGGDLLYRWGNPLAYGRGNVSNQVFYGQHDAQWVEPEMKSAGNILVYNNGESRPGGSYSSIEEFVPPLDSSGNYILNTGSSYGPSATVWTYSATPQSSFFSSKISGASRMPNGNTLICEGANGRFFEVDSLGGVHWEYINPSGGTGVMAQGQPPNQNSVFRVYRYAPDYPGLDGQNLIPGNPIELNSWPYSCTIWWDSLTSIPTNGISEFSIWPNPVQNDLMISFPDYLPSDQISYSIIDISGRIIFNGVLNERYSSINTSMLSKGIYLLNIDGRAALKFVKQ